MRAVSARERWCCVEDEIETLRGVLGDIDASSKCIGADVCIPEDVKRARAILDALAAKSDEDLVRALGDRIGYGRTMQLAEELWRERLPRDGLPVGGELTVGPCAAALVPCVCEREDRHLCAWCCGTGRVTRRVRRAAEADGRARLGLPF